MSKQKEILARTSKKGCNCGYKCRGEGHMEGSHHMKRKLVQIPALGVKTNVGDPLSIR